MLAGVSVDYYTRLERGNLPGVSESVLDALAQALQLDEAERGHLFDLAPSRCHDATSPAAFLDTGATEHAVGLGRDHQCAGVGAQRPTGLPCRQQAGVRPVFGDVQRRLFGR